MNNTLSIVTACQDEEEPIKWYLESCAHAAEHIPGLKEVILIDGGSKDNTIDVILSYQDRIPLKLIQRPWDFTRAQQNYALEQATGDFVFGPDADMTWTTNFSDVFNSGLFQQGAYWDFPMIFTVRDAYHYFKNWQQGINMRLWKRGPKWGEHRKYHVQLEGQTQGIPVCQSVVIFENSCRITNDAALLNRGERRQICIPDMQAEGAAPGSPTLFLEHAHVPDSEVAPLPEHFTSLSLILPSTNNY
jgi:glycosyltransferase involved in cell wall biosynthesis